MLACKCEAPGHSFIADAGCVKLRRSSRELCINQRRPKVVCVDCLFGQSMLGGCALAAINHDMSDLRLGDWS